MAEIKVSPPPVSRPFVDPGTGMVTRAAQDFLYSLWKRSGGSTDYTADALTYMMSFQAQTGLKPGLNDATFAAQIAGLQTEVDTLESQNAALTTRVEALETETQALRLEIERLRDELYLMSVRGSETAELRRESDAIRVLSLMTPYCNYPV